jgi:hypothetical protein
VLAVGREHAVVSGEVYPWFGHQRRQPRDEVQGLEKSIGLINALLSEHQLLLPS